MRRLSHGGWRLRIGIIGCGIAGQASAIALARRGHDVTILERFPEARPVGAGLLLQPSGQQALARLGLLRAALASGERIAQLYGATAHGRMVMDLRYGEFAEGAFGLGIHRAALFDILHGSVQRTATKLRLGFDIVSIKSPERPRLIARDGREEGPFDLVLNCAGAHDTLRNAFPHRVRAELYPWGALWTTCRDRTGAFAGRLQQRCRGTGVMVGILPVGHVPRAEGRHVAFFWSVRLADHQRTQEKGLDALKAHVLSVWPETAPILEEINRFEDFSLATYRDVRLRPWRAGRVVALGDAAHGTSPQLGQGANLSLIDSIILADTLEQERDVDRALALYERRRRRHVGFYQWASRSLTPFFQSDSMVLGLARDLFLGPIGKLPVMDHVMRTTLAGVRMFPFGLHRLPPGSVMELDAAADPDGDDVSRVSHEEQHALAAGQSPPE
jgi:2-polyprenyl-6-methoxyphenol hydroxylase-like FAD-dependent oxidoreductase